MTYRPSALLPSLVWVRRQHPRARPHKSSSPRRWIITCVLTTNIIIFSSAAYLLLYGHEHLILDRKATWRTIAQMSRYTYVMKVTYWLPILHCYRPIFPLLLNGHENLILDRKETQQMIAQTWSYECDEKAVLIIHLTLACVHFSLFVSLGTCKVDHRQEGNTTDTRSGFKL